MPPLAEPNMGLWLPRSPLRRFDVAAGIHRHRSLGLHAVLDPRRRACREVCREHLHCCIEGRGSDFFLVCDLLRDLLGRTKFVYVDELLPRHSDFCSNPYLPPCILPYVLDTDKKAVRAKGMALGCSPIPLMNVMLQQVTPIVFQ